jgi:hypothetical protein
VVAPAATVRLDGTVATFVLLVESWTRDARAWGSTGQPDSPDRWVASHDRRWIHAQRDKMGGVMVNIAVLVPAL